MANVLISKNAKSEGESLFSGFSFVFKELGIPNVMDYVQDGKTAMRLVGETTKAIRDNADALAEKHVKFFGGNAVSAKKAVLAFSDALLEASKTEKTAYAAGATVSAAFYMMERGGEKGSRMLETIMVAINGDCANGSLANTEMAGTIAVARTAGQAAQEGNQNAARKAISSAKSGGADAAAASLSTSGYSSQLASELKKASAFLEKLVRMRSKLVRITQARKKEIAIMMDDIRSEKEQELAKDKQKEAQGIISRSRFKHDQA